MEEQYVSGIRGGGAALTAQHNAMFGSSMQVGCMWTTIFVCILQIWTAPVNCTLQSLFYRWNICTMKFCMHFANMNGIYLFSQV